MSRRACCSTIVQPLEVYAKSHKTRLHDYMLTCVSLRLVVQLNINPTALCNRWCSVNFSHARILSGNFVVKITYSILSTRDFPWIFSSGAGSRRVCCSLWEIDCHRMEFMSGPPTAHGLMVHRPSIGLKLTQGTFRTVPNSSHSNKADLVNLSSSTLVPLPMTYRRDLLSLWSLPAPYTY